MGKNMYNDKEIPYYMYKLAQEKLLEKINSIK